MNKVKTIKIKNEDGSVSEESYAIAADALNIDMANGKNVQETIGTIDVDNDGNVATQLKKKINKSDIIDNLDSSDNNKVLSAKQGKVLNEAVAAANSDIKKKIYYFNTIAEMKADEDLVAGDTCQTLGYYEENDGGAGLYKIVDDSQLVDDGGSIHNLLNGLKAELIIEDNTINIKQFGAKSDGIADDTLAFQSCINKYNNIYIPIGTYKINNNIQINEHTRINGESMRNTIINFTNNEDYLFKYLTPINVSAYDRKINIELNNFKVNCKNFIKINENNLEDENWIKQGSLLRLVFKNLWLYGIYNTITDDNKDTNVLPDLETLLNYGCGFNCNSVFDSAIQDCRIERFGVGIYFKGCDINRIEHNRINGNGCHIYLDRVGTYGSQNRILHNDILHNLRYGGIRVQGTCFDTIEDNYFECYTPSACAIYAENERSLSIINNRFDNPSQTDIDLIRLNPQNTDNVTLNRVNPSSANNHCYINVLWDNHGSFQNKLIYNTAYITDNNEKLERRNNPFTLGNIRNNLLISPYNIIAENQKVGGTRFVQPYFLLDETENLYYFLDTTSANTSLILQFLNLKKNYAKFAKIRIKYKSTESNNYVVIRDENNTVLFNNFVTLNNDGTLRNVDIDLTANETLYDLLRIEIPVKAGVKIFSVELI